MVGLGSLVWPAMKNDKSSVTSTISRTGSFSRFRLNATTARVSTPAIKPARNTFNPWVCMRYFIKLLFSSGGHQQRRAVHQQHSQHEAGCVAKVEQVPLHAGHHRFAYG